MSYSNVMTKLLVLWLVVGLMELGLRTLMFWRWRGVLAGVIAVLVTLTSLLIFALQPAVPSGLIVFISAFRVFNLLRIVKNRLHQRHMGKATLNTSAYLQAGQLLVLWLWLTADYLHLGSYVLWNLLVGAQIAVALVLVGATLRQAKKMRPPKLAESLVDNKLPTLTVAVPARNETDSLEACLRSIIASDYPKMEVLVLDDCSQQKRTPEIIRSFAHDGVQFIQGNEPQPSWLAKNQAYQRLLDEANGELVLFCGVDVRFEPSSLRVLIGSLLQKDKQMISLMPQNVAPKRLTGWRTVLLQPMRYAWEVALPRRLFNRPPVLSTCWLARRSFLNKVGGFAAVSRSITPESYFAKQSIKMNDGYSFMRAEGELMISSEKTISQQRDTAIRTRYPQLHRRPEQVCLMALLQFVTVLAPPLMVLVFAIIGNWTLLALSLANCLLLLFFYEEMVRLAYGKLLAWSLPALPFAAAYNIWLTLISMWKYEFSEVIWKGRNVCLPVYQVLPHLPKLGSSSYDNSYDVPAAHSPGKSR